MPDHLILQLCATHFKEPWHSPDGTPLGKSHIDALQLFLISVNPGL